MQMNSEHQTIISKAHSAGVQQFQRTLAGFAGEPVADFLGTLAFAQEKDTPDGKRCFIGGNDITKSMMSFEQTAMADANARAAFFRKNSRTARNFPGREELSKGGYGALSKAALDVGVLTDIAQVTGGQSLGVISMDTNVARGTIRPGSFTLYQMLKKTRANQIVDFWPYAAETGGPLPGSAFASYNSVSSGTMGTSAGIYDMKTITLKLALDGRAITAALAAQNSFVDITGQETANAALAVLSSLDWALFWGNPSMYPNQPSGLKAQIDAGAPDANTIDFQVYKTAQSAAGLSDAQLLFNLIFAQVSEIVKYRTYGIPTHAIMGVGTAADLQTLVTTNLQQIANVQTVYGDHGPLVINGNVVGMNTRFGDIQFPIDLLMTARDIPAAAIVYDDGTTPATTVAPSPPASVTVAASGAANAGSDWTATYVAASGVYAYAVATTDANMRESTLTYVDSSAVTLLGAYVLTINAPSAHDQYAYRVYRSGLGNAVHQPAKFRHIGDVIAAPSNGATTFVDLNTKIPGSETIFLLDLDEVDDAFDYRYLLPLSKIELFAQNLYMPWAVACIGSPRVRVPKWHGYITNYVPNQPDWNPLKAN